MKLRSTPPHQLARIDNEVAQTRSERLKAAFTRPGDIPRFINKYLDNWHDVVRLQYLRWQHGNTLTREVQSSQMILDLRDRGIQRTLALHGIREPAYSTAYQEALQQRNPSFVADIGANVGYFVLMALAYSDADLLAVEPVPKNLQSLRENIVLNGYGRRTTIFEGAVGDQHREAVLKISDQSNMHKLVNTGSPDHRKYETITVQERPLDWYLDELNIAIAEVDVLRMDVEGYEHQIITGLDHLPGDCLLAFEWHGYNYMDGGYELISKLQDADAKIMRAFSKWGEVTESVKKLEDLTEYSMLNLLVDIPRL